MSSKAAPEFDEGVDIWPWEIPLPILVKHVRGGQVQNLLKCPGWSRQCLPAHFQVSMVSHLFVGL